jgi:predicted RecA/RadA family phage recombinase
MAQLRANTRFRKSVDVETFRTDGVGPVSAGDLVMFDTTLKRLTAGSGPKFVGVAQDQIPLASALDSQFTATDVPVIRQGVFAMIPTSGDTYSNGDAVYVGATAQTVKKKTAEADTEIIGYAWLPLGGTVVGATAASVDVLIVANFPAVGIPA